MNKHLKKIGICIKSLDGTVEYQNPKCIEICGNQLNQKCQKGCMIRHSRNLNNPEFSEGYKILKNVNPTGNPTDGIMIDDGTSLTTLLFDKKDSTQKQIATLKKYHLSDAELVIIEKYIQGMPNHEIAESLFISKATLRTHLNNIYKKIPEILKKEIMVVHQHTT